MLNQGARKPYYIKFTTPTTEKVQLCVVPLTGVVNVIVSF